MFSSPKELLTLLLTSVGCRSSDRCLRPVSDDLASTQLMLDTPHIEGVYTPRPAGQLIVEDECDLVMRRGPRYTLLQLETMYARIVQEADSIPLHRKRPGGEIDCPASPSCSNGASGIHARNLCPVAQALSIHQVLIFGSSLDWFFLHTIRNSERSRCPISSSPTRTC